MRRGRGGDDLRAVPAFAAGAVEEIPQVERSGHPIEILSVQTLRLHFQDAEDVAPLAVGYLATHPIPRELSQHDVFGAGDVESTLRAFHEDRLSPPELFPVQEAVPTHEQVDLHEGVAVN